MASTDAPTTITIATTDAANSNSNGIVPEPKLDVDDNLNKEIKFRLSQKLGREFSRLIPHGINGGCAALFIGSYTGTISFENDASILMDWANTGIFVFPVVKTFLCIILKKIGLNFPVPITGVCGAAFGYYYGNNDLGKRDGRIFGFILFGCIAALTEYVISRSQPSLFLKSSP